MRRAEDPTLARLGKFSVGDRLFICLEMAGLGLRTESRTARAVQSSTPKARCQRIWTGPDRDFRRCGVSVMVMTSPAASGATYYT